MSFFGSMNGSSATRAFTGPSNGQTTSTSDPTSASSIGTYT